MATTTPSKRDLTISGEQIASTDVMTHLGKTVATKEFVITSITNLVNSAPVTLDTLNELAAALGDDPNFSTTISTSIGNKLDATVNPIKSATVSNDTITFTHADDTTSEVTTLDKDTTYSIGDGGLTTKNFTAALKTKLDGIDAGAKVDQDLTPVVEGAHANYSMSGGGTVTWKGSVLKWTSRIICIPVSKSLTSNGHIDIAANTGIDIPAWHGLYWIHNRGGDYQSGTLQVLDYNGTSVKPNENWLLIAQHNADTGSLKWMPGVIILPGGDSNFNADSGVCSWNIGPKGDKGNPGTNGTNGTDGSNGTNGVDGVDGDPGTNGSDGTNGTDGERGVPGSNGTNGSDGRDGAPGLPGAPGADGTDGVNGTDGTNGADGSDGSRGPAGTDGTDGVDGVQGIQGDKGDKGDTGDTLAVTSNSNNRVITATGGSTVQAETNLTFSGTTLGIAGSGISFDGVTMRFTV